MAHAESLTVFGQELDLRGSLRDGGFSTYTPSVMNPLFNETPLMTTELRPFYAYHDVPDDFVTGGGDIQVAAAQARIAFSERFAFIATTDGYTNVDWEGVLTDDDGPNDIAFGAKYALYYAPEEREILTIGARYTAPAGNISTFLGDTEIELNGVGGGFVNIFATGLKQYYDDRLQVQGSAGVQFGVSSESYDFFHGTATIAYEIIPGLTPMLEATVFAPIDGGDRFDGPLNQLTGAEFLDVGAGDPQLITTLGGSVRWRPFEAENVVLGFGGEANVSERQDTAYGFRLITDLVVHF